jgi:hypothetical protein
MVQELFELTFPYYSPLIILHSPVVEGLSFWLRNRWSRGLGEITEYNKCVWGDIRIHRL